jgi:hypothetical protein
MTGVIAASRWCANQLGLGGGRFYPYPLDFVLNQLGAARATFPALEQEDADIILGVDYGIRDICRQCRRSITRSSLK